MSIIVIIMLFFSRRVSIIRNKIDRSMLYIAGRIFKQKQNQMVIYEYYNQKVLTEIKINQLPEDIKNKTIEQLNLEDKYNIRVLYINRKNKIITKLKNTKFRKKDLVLMIGNKKKISKLFE